MRVSVDDMEQRPTNRRVGILGGTFNPVHVGHLVLAQTALDACNLSSVWFIPCCRPPHKSSSGLIPARHRMAMLKSAIRGNPRFRVCDIELRRGGVSYAVDTIDALRIRHPRTDFVFLIGADALPELHHWRDIRRLLRLCAMAVFARPGWPVVRPRLPAPWSARIMSNVHAERVVDVSSSEIRNLVARGASIRYLVPDGVARYIGKHRLYNT
jgi:nicotinate-nucleotide adenylyltransferase